MTSCPDCGAPDDQACSRACPRLYAKYPREAVQVAYERGKADGLKEAAQTVVPQVDDKGFVKLSEQSINTIVLRLAGALHL